MMNIGVEKRYVDNNELQPHYNKTSKAWMTFDRFCTWYEWSITVTMTFDCLCTAKMYFATTGMNERSMLQQIKITPYEIWSGEKHIMFGGIVA